MRPNRLRELLNDGKPSLGTRLHNIWPGITELVGHSGMFDYVEFVAEYAPYDLHGLDNLGRAIAIYPQMTGMMKIEQQPRTYLAIRAIGAGIQNLLFADCRTVADVEECVRSVRAETPETGGLHGCGLRRDAGYVIDVATPAYIQALEDAVVAIMIEKREAVDNLESLLAVKGVDMVQFGPGDYSMSIGVPGQFNHPRVREAEKYVIETALAAGSPAARRDQRAGAGAALPGNGRPPLQHRQRYVDPVPLVLRQRQGNERAARHQRDDR